MQARWKKDPWSDTLPTTLNLYSLAEDVFKDVSWDVLEALLDDSYILEDYKKAVKAMKGYYIGADEMPAHLRKKLGVPAPKKSRI